MKRILTVALVFCLLTTPLSLFGCKQKNTSETTGTTTAQNGQATPYTYTGAVYVDQSALAGTSLQNVSEITNMRRYQLHYDIMNPVQDDTAERSKTVVFRGRSHLLTYKETIRRADGEAYHVYVIKPENINPDIFDGNPTLSRALYHYDVTALKVDVRTGRILTIANLPDAPYWFDQTPTEEELRAAAIELARPYTDMPFETYAFSCQSVYRVTGPEYSEWRVADGIQTKYPNEKYYVEFRYKVDDKPIAQRVVVKIRESGTPIVICCYTDLTEADEAKIAAFDEAAMREQAKAYVREHLQEGTVLREVTFTDEQFDKEGGKLWWNIYMELRTGADDRSADVIPIVLRVEVI